MNQYQETRLVLYLQKSAAGTIPTGEAGETAQKAPGFLHSAGKLILGAAGTIAGGAGLKFIGGKAMGAAGEHLLGKATTFMAKPETTNALENVGKGLSAKITGSSWYNDAKKIYHDFTNTSPATDIVNKAKFSKAPYMSPRPVGRVSVKQTPPPPPPNPVRDRYIKGTNNVTPNPKPISFN